MATIFEIPASVAQAWNAVTGQAVTPGQFGGVLSSVLNQPPLPDMPDEVKASTARELARRAAMARFQPGMTYDEMRNAQQAVGQALPLRAPVAAQTIPADAQAEAARRVAAANLNRYSDFAPRTGASSVAQKLQAALNQGPPASIALADPTGLAARVHMVPSDAPIGAPPQLTHEQTVAEMARRGIGQNLLADGTALRGKPLNVRFAPGGIVDRFGPAVGTKPGAESPEMLVRQSMLAARREATRQERQDRVNAIAQGGLIDRTARQYGPESALQLAMKLGPPTGHNMYTALLAERAMPGAGAAMFETSLKQKLLDKQAEIQDRHDAGQRKHELAMTKLVEDGKLTQAQADRKTRVEIARLDRQAAKESADLVAQNQKEANDLKRSELNFQMSDEYRRDKKLAIGAEAGDPAAMRELVGTREPYTDPALPPDKRREAERNIALASFDAKHKAAIAAGETPPLIRNSVMEQELRDFERNANLVDGFEFLRPLVKTKGGQRLMTEALRGQMLKAGYRPELVEQYLTEFPSR